MQVLASCYSGTASIPEELALRHSLAVYHEQTGKVRVMRAISVVVLNDDVKSVLATSGTAGQDDRARGRSADRRDGVVLQPDIDSEGMTGAEVTGYWPRCRPGEAVA